MMLQLEKRIGRWINTRLVGAFSLGFVFLFMSVSAQADREVVGWIEQVHIQGITKRLRAKLDSGARTSSIHGVNPKVFTRNGDKWLRFEFKWRQSNPVTTYGPYIIEAPLARRVKIKDHDDPSQRRPVVELPISINGECYVTEFSVADREGFLYPVLLGRRFLAGKMIIDPKRRYTDASDRRNGSACTKKDAKDAEVSVSKPEQVIGAKTDSDED